jgi:hypothetical protein
MGRREPIGSREALVDIDVKPQSPITASGRPVLLKVWYSHASQGPGVFTITLPPGPVALSATGALSQSWPQTLNESGAFYVDPTFYCLGVPPANADATASLNDVGRTGTTEMLAVEVQ